MMSIPWLVAYSSTMNPINLQASFKKAGIYPLLTGEHMCRYLSDKIKPSTLYVDPEKDNGKVEKDAGNVERDNVNVGTCKVDANENQAVDTCEFFCKRKGVVVEKLNKKKRRSVNAVVGGKALEGDTVEKLKIYMDESKSKCKVGSVKQVSVVKKCVRKPVKCTSKIDPINVLASPVQGPSHVNLVSDSMSVGSDSENEPPEDDNEVCCVCKCFYVPRKLRDGTLHITQWAQCDSCGHWVHLKYCTPVRVVRKNTEFKCECCM